MSAVTLRAMHGQAFRLAMIALCLLSFLVAAYLANVFNEAASSVALGLLLALLVEIVASGRGAAR